MAARVRPACKKTRVDVLRGEIERMRRATDETQSRWRSSQFAPPTEVVRLPRHGNAILPLGNRNSVT